MPMHYEPHVKFDRYANKFTVGGQKFDNPFSANIFDYLFRIPFSNDKIDLANCFRFVAKDLSGPAVAVAAVEEFEKALTRSTGRRVADYLGVGEWTDWLKDPRNLISVKDIVMNAAIKLGGYAMQQQQLEFHAKNGKTNPYPPDTDLEEYINFAIYGWAADPTYGPYYRMWVEPGSLAKK